MSEAKPGRARSMVSWGLLDQVVASGTTFMFVVIVAQTASPSEVGAMALGFEFYLLSVMVTRGLCGDPLTSQYAGSHPDALRRPVRSAATTAVAVGIVIGALLAIGATQTAEPLRQVLLVAAIALPGLTLQDYVRSALIVQGRVRATFVNDVLWATTQAPAMVLAAAIHPTPAAIFGAWAATGALAAVVGLVQLRTWVGPPAATRQWLRDTRKLWPYYVTDYAVFQGAVLLLMFIVSATAGLTAMAGFRVAMTVYAPLTLIGRGVLSVAVALLAPKRNEPGVVRRQALTISVILTPMALAWGLLTPLIPTDLGTAVFGEAWREAEEIVFLTGFVCASSLFGIGVAIGLRALGAGRHAVAGRLLASSTATAAAGVGGYLGDERGLFLGLALCFPAQAAVWWLLLRHAARPAARNGDADHAAPGGTAQ